MPSSMIHLLTAYKYNPNASVDFWIGNIAPDTAACDWKEKDRTHFRDRKDRLNALRELAFTMDLDEDLNKGILLHLFLDYCWDTSPMSNFIDDFKEGNWFPVYRHEISLATGWLFHHTDWGKSIWEEMMACPMSVYENVHGLVKEDVTDFINSGSKWHIENNIGPSTAFTPDFIEEFTSKVVTDFKNWLENESVN